MENHVYKHHFRHGHHHHKHQTFFALLAMTFFALITLGVVASIYYTLGGEKKFTGNNGGVANICIEGAEECDDTVVGDEAAPAQGNFVVIQEPSGSAKAFSHATGNYSFTVPAGMEVAAVTPDYSPMDVVVGYPDTKSIFGVSVSRNNGLTLNDALSNVISQMVPDADDRPADLVTSNVTIDGAAARRLSVKNWGDTGETVFVAINDGMVYMIRGSTGQDWVEEDTDVLNFVKGFKFLD